MILYFGEQASRQLLNGHWSKPNRYMGTIGFFVGMTTLDYVYYTPQLPMANTKIRTEMYRRYIGGPAANAAITYSLLGGDAYLYTCIGSSPEADMIADELKHYGVKLVNCSDNPQLPDISTIVIDENGSRTIFSGQGAYKNVSFERPKVKPDFVLFDLNRQELSIPMLEYFAENKDGTDIVLDAGSFKGNTESFLQYADIVISSEKFTDAEGRSIFDIKACANAKKAITRGEKDILTDRRKIPVPKVKCVDSLAAGDIFHGAFCFGYYVKNMEFEEALGFAAGVASESVTHEGPRIVAQKY